MSLKVAVRALVKTPGFSIVAILTIAVAIGANTALFSAFDRLVLHPADATSRRRKMPLHGANVCLLSHERWASRYSAQAAQVLG